MFDSPSTYDWTQAELTYYYDAHIARVFNAWTSVAGLESFLVQRCVFMNERGEGKPDATPPVAGDRYQWYFQHDYQTEGLITVLEDRQRLVFTLEGTIVTLLFRPVKQVTELRLIHSLLPDAPEDHVMWHLNWRSCWTFFLTNLAAVITTGRDLRLADNSLALPVRVDFKPLSAQPGN
ncbi:MAG: SRPBCC domain-containing protein [Pseudomonadales bacterium]|nr:SRPBCC domain-containing protein [Pseudomonadales bacterium]